MRGASWTNVVLGVWLFIAPWVLQYGSGSATGNDMTLGVLVFIAAIWSVSAAGVTAGPAWANVIFGIWLIVAPWVVGYHALNSRATTNDVIVGIVVLVLAAIRIGAAHSTTPGGTTPGRLP